MRPDERMGRIHEGLTVGSRWCAGCAADNGPPGVTTRTVAIYSPIRNGYFGYAGGPQGPSHPNPDIKIQPSLQATHRGTRCLPFLTTK